MLYFAQGVFVSLPVTNSIIRHTCILCSLPQKHRGPIRPCKGSSVDFLLIKCYPFMPWQHCRQPLAHEEDVVVLACVRLDKGNT